MRSRRPKMPASYGLHPTADEAGLLPWAWAVERLQRARNYWLVTARQQGRPHSAPVWGIWAEGQLLFGTSRHSRKALNLLGSAACGVHLESGDEVVILEGTANPVVDAAALERFAERYQAKYDFRPQVDDGETLTFCFRPSKGMGWREADFPSSATCWELD
jgi:hypothetical protein